MNKATFKFHYRIARVGMFDHYASRGIAVSLVDVSFCKELWKLRYEVTDVLAYNAKHNINTVRKHRN